MENGILQDLTYDLSFWWLFSIVTAYRVNENWGVTPNGKYNHYVLLAGCMSMYGVSCCKIVRHTHFRSCELIYHFVTFFLFRFIPMRE